MHHVARYSVSLVAPSQGTGSVLSQEGAASIDRSRWKPLELASARGARGDANGRQIKALSSCAWAVRNVRI